VTEPAEGRKQEEPAALAARTTEVVVAYLTRNSVAISDLGHVIETVGRALAALGREEIEPASARPAPAVPVRRSIQQDHLVCLVCGKQQKTLRRHLDVVHQLTPEAYRALFGLKPDYPMTAPSYARYRSEAARRVGLGHRVQPPSRLRQPRTAR
jgi:predicted transcriptional regulator